MSEYSRVCSQCPAVQRNITRVVLMGQTVLFPAFCDRQSCCSEQPFTSILSHLQGVAERFAFQGRNRRMQSQPPDRSQQSTLHPASSCSRIHPQCHRAPAFPPICQWNMLSHFEIFAKRIARKQYCFVGISPMSELEQLSILLIIISDSFSLNQTFVSLAQLSCLIIDLCHISF